MSFWGEIYHPQIYLVKSIIPNPKHLGSSSITLTRFPSYLDCLEGSINLSMLSHLLSPHLKWIFNVTLLVYQPPQVSKKNISSAIFGRIPDVPLCINLSVRSCEWVWCGSRWQLSKWPGSKPTKLTTGWCCPKPKIHGGNMHCSSCYHAPTIWVVHW